MANAKESTIRVFNVSSGQVEEVEKVIKTPDEWKKSLTPEQFRVTREKATEKPFGGQCGIPPKSEGVYKCVGCANDLFLVEKKFESGTGWPSFWEPVSDLNVTEKEDNSSGMTRIEVVCSRCDAHLGHVFNDGPPPTGKRYCINGAALVFAAQVKPAKRQSAKATFAAGCFWGVEAEFCRVKGVLKTTVGYTGGTTRNPTYEEVCSHTTGHAEAVEILYDPAEVSYGRLLELFWNMHDPTTPNRQGLDTGSQYRSAIFFHTPHQEREALASKKDLEKSGKFKSPLVTEIVPAREFYPAEEYHQRYYEKHGMKAACRIPSASHGKIR